MREIIGEQDDDGLWDRSIFYSSYIAGNLLSCVDANIRPDDALEASDHCIDKLFDLASEVKGIPETLRQVSEITVESAYLQTILRSVITATRRLEHEGDSISSDIATALLGSWPTLYNVAGSLNARLKRMLQQYGEIEREFQKQQSAAKPLLKSSPYERNVFVMMPFRQQVDENFKTIERIIRRELKKKGFCAWLSSDRVLDPDLWDNITTYMTGCKYGIAVFARKEKLSEGRIEPDFNPNVSLELGFMLSRAKRILILKDSFLTTLYTDLMGQLYMEFDLRRVGSQLPRIIRAWADDTLLAEEEQANNSEA